MKQAVPATRTSTPPRAKRWLPATFTGTFTHDRNRIDGTWEIAHERQTWQKDFGLVYTRVG